MDLIWFRDLRNLAATGHFSRAARMSHLSQPAFSRRIKALEQWAGTVLVDRSRHPVSLTSAGEQLLEAGEQALDRLDTERQSILDAQSLPESYVVTFGAQHSIGWRFYPAWLQAFEDSFGPIISRLRADDLPNCRKDLMDGEVDFVIAYSSRFSSGFDARQRVDSVLIGSDRLVAVCKPNPDGSPLFDLSETSEVKLPYLRFGTSAPIGEHLEPLLSEHGLQSRLGVVYENSMAGALRIRARDGAGVCWLPYTLIAPDLDSGRLTQTGDPAWEIGLDIYLYRRREAGNVLTQQIWDHLSADEPLSLGSRL